MPRHTRRAGWLALAAGATLIGILARPTSGRANPAGDPGAPGPSAVERLRPLYRRPVDVPHPDDNAPTPARVALGKALFFDPRLSRSQDISCASCHMPDRGWQDGRAKAVGTRGQQLGRHTPTVLNTAYGAALFWDGRAATLEEQALGPIAASGEMDLPLDSLPARVSAVAGYRRMIAGAYPGRPVTAALVASAIASFERTVVSGRAPFDRWVDGDDAAISDGAKRGFAVFNGKGQCAQCHSGWRFTDDSFHDIGVAGADSGRVRILPGIEMMEFAFKTPTLRDLAKRAPYMHDGSERTLADVIAFYDAGGRARRRSLAAEIKPLHLTPDERRDLLAFMTTLDAPAAAIAPPTLPR